MITSRWQLWQLLAAPWTLVACGRPSARSGTHPLTAVVTSATPSGGPSTDARIFDSLRAQSTDSLLALGERIYLRGAYDSARAVWSTALTQSRVRGDSAATARLLTWLGLAAWRTGDYGRARSLGEEALALKQRWALRADLSKSYNALGLLAWNEGRFADATELFGNASAAAQAARDRRGVAAAAGNLALVETELGEFAEARRGFDSARVAGHALGDARIEGNALTNLGMLDVRIGAPKAAIAALENARRLYAALPYPLGEQNALAQLGTAYAALGEPRLAIAAVDSALALSRKHGLLQEEAGNLEALADLYHDAGDYPRALALYAEAGATNQALGLGVEAGSDLRSEAEIHRDLGTPDRARELAAAALEAHQAAGARFEELDDRLLLADLAARTGRDAEAAEQLTRGRELARLLGARRARADLGLATARIADRRGDGRTALGALHSAARDLADGGYGEEEEAERLAMRAYARLGLLDSAAAAGRRSVAALERTRARYGSGVLRTAYLADRRATYSDLVEVLRRLGRTEDAMTVADESRGRVLLESLAAGHTVEETPAESGRRAAEERLLLQIDALAEQLRIAEGAGDTDTSTRVKAAFLRARLEAARSEYERLAIATEEASPRSAVVGAIVPDMPSIRQALAFDEALLEYLLTDDSLVVFVATPTRVTSIAVAISAGRLATRVRLTRELIVQTRYQPTARLVALDSLYQLLIAPARRMGLLDQARRLLLVPNGVLTYFPFAALRDPQTGRFLIQDFTLIELPSAAALTALRTAQPEVAASLGPASVFAPDVDRLPGTASEATAVQRALRTAHVFTNARATERAVRQALTTAGVVHVATHADMNAHNPLFSYIELARVPGTGMTGDGRLEVHEILGLHIRSNLVFLSGCETALGAGAATDFAPGEDYATLARAFLYAGARNVVATLWRVEDRGAAELAGRFYRYLPGHSAAEALALVQRELLVDPRYRTPYYWAGYVLSGSGESAGTQNVRSLSVKGEGARRAHAAFSREGV